MADIGPIPGPPLPDYRYVYDAVPIRVVDGDTIVFEVRHSHDMGFRIVTEHRHTLAVRLMGINCPETRGVDAATREAGLAAKKYTEQWLSAWVNTDTGYIKLVTYQDKGDKYGRYLAEVWNSDWSSCLNNDLYLAGYAKEYWP